VIIFVSVSVFSEHETKKIIERKLLKEKFLMFSFFNNVFLVVYNVKEITVQKSGKKGRYFSLWTL